MSFDGIIATYNRPEAVVNLVHSLLKCKPAFTSIIVCDSSDKPNTSLAGLDRVFYIHSNHKNQPYQRYLGYMLSQSEYIVYFDDDMEIVNLSFLTVFDEKFKDQNVVGIQPKMKNLNDNSTIIIRDSVLSKLWQNDHWLINCIRWITMYPRLSNGKWWYCGLRGSKPNNHECNLEWLSGWAFAAKRSALFKNINFQLFDLFENKTGMGEDLLIGHYLSKVGTVKYIPELLFLHNDQRNSNYTPDHFSFGKRTMFSRYFLSMEYARLNYEHFLKARVIFWYYAFFRIAGMIINLIFRHSRQDKELFRGTISGVKSLYRFKYKTDRDAFWTGELLNNINHA
jgi:glycosyltransferase involved in cell wall biosynthesis